MSSVDHGLQFASPAIRVEVAELRDGLPFLKVAGGGVLLYLDQEGTGIGANERACHMLDIEALLEAE